MDSFSLMLLAMSAGLIFVCSYVGWKWSLQLIFGGAMACLVVLGLLSLG